MKNIELTDEEVEMIREACEHQLESCNDAIREAEGQEGLGFLQERDQWAEVLDALPAAD